VGGKARGRQDGGFKNERKVYGWIRPSYRSYLAEIKENLLHGGPRAVQPPAGWPGKHLYL